jgi:hypothetical protein
MPDHLGIGGVDKNLFEHVWAFHKQLEEREKHFNGLQSRYRALASTWLLAAFAGIGFVLTNTLPDLWPPSVIAVFLSFAGAIGITLLWTLDVLVYHELLMAGYVVGKRLEEEYAWLPPVRTNPRKPFTKSRVRWYIALFYASGVTVLCLSAVLISWSDRGPWLGAFSLLVGVALDTLIIRGTSHALRISEELEGHLQQSWPPETAVQPVPAAPPAS